MPCAHAHTKDNSIQWLILMEFSDEKSIVANEMLSSLSSATTASLVYASLNSNNNSNKHSTGVSLHKLRPDASHKSETTPKQKRKQPSVEEMERAIGAGVFRDRDPSGSGEKQSLFDLLSETPMNQPESPIEKKLRETGEWLVGDTEGPSRSAGQDIFLTVCLTILPMWVLFLLIAFGTVKLPFDIPGLEDLIM